ncbi:MAG: DUF4160 domain-containing protein [Sphingomonadaceae bacterium]|nr:DUF4160 domain-containing protein [Sphingomonadaceae bacterium]
MPSVLHVRGFRFYFYSHEPNEPPHVHVDKDSATLKVWLDPVEYARNRGFRRHEINGIVKLVAENRRVLLEAWHEHFGKDNR